MTPVVNDLRYLLVGIRIMCNCYGIRCHLSERYLNHVVFREFKYYRSLC